MKWFGNDKNGLSEKDFEKLILGVLLIIVVLAIVIKYILNDLANMDMVYLATMLGSLFVVRKAASYFKPDRYNATTNNEENNNYTDYNNNNNDIDNLNI